MGGSSGLPGDLKGISGCCKTFSRKFQGRFRSFSVPPGSSTRFRGFHVVSRRFRRYESDFRRFQEAEEGEGFIEFSCKQTCLQLFQEVMAAFKRVLKRCFNSF